MQHELYEGTWVIKRWFIILSELEKILYLFSNSDWEIFDQDGMWFENEIWKEFQILFKQSMTII
jgi:hypothetical protein